MRIVILFIFIFSGCSSNDSGFLKQDLDQVYIGSGLEKFFLSDLPTWANFSSTAQCKRKEPVRYLHFQNMFKSYSMDYEQLIQFQYMLNKKFASYKISTGRKTIFLKDESYILYNVHQQIIGGSRDFITPKFNRINIVWVDDILTSKNGSANKRLKKLMYSKEMEKGHPVFISTCLSSIELELFISKMGYTKFGVKGISQGMFSPYNSEYQFAYQYELDLNLLMPNKELFFYGSSFPKVFRGIKEKNLIKF